MGVIVINVREGIANSRDKLVACQLMAEAGVPVPITANVGAWEDTVRAVNQVGGTPCVIKSNEGTHGSGVFLAHTEQQARRFHDHERRNFKTFGMNVIFNYDLQTE